MLNLSQQNLVNLAQRHRKETLTPAGIDAAVNQTRVLVAPSESGDGFSRHYFDALQRDPDVVIAHGELIKHLGRRKA